jgi:Copper/zinc superoxide dismutase (SODC)
MTGSSSASGACKAVCVLASESGGYHILGSLTLTQADVNGNVVITGTLSGLSPNSKHGLTVCQNGDITKGAASCGPIFNPFGPYNF